MNTTIANTRLAIEAKLDTFLENSGPPTEKMTEMTAPKMTTTNRTIYNIAIAARKESISPLKVLFMGSFFIAILITIKNTALEYGSTLQVKPLQGGASSAMLIPYSVVVSGLCLGYNKHPFYANVNI